MLRLFSKAAVLKAFALATASTALMSCDSSPKAGGGIGGTGEVNVSSVSSGSVTKLGSVYVSGTKYDTSNALYCIDDEPCTTQSSLKVGMVIHVKGSAQTLPDGSVNRVADAIAFHHTAKGIVQSVAPDGSSLVVLGQFVAVDATTIVDIPGGLSTLRPGVDVIEVSGLVAGDGHIAAGFIMKGSGIEHYAIEGKITNHDPGSQRFDIGQLVVTYSAANVDEMTGGDPTSWNNRLVYVRGKSWEPSMALPYGGTLSATKVEPLGLKVDDSPEAKLEGFVTHAAEGGALTVNNHPIDVSSNTVFENGTANELGLGTHVVIHGTLAQKRLNAQLVSFKENVQIESDVQSIDLQSGTLALAGLPGVLVGTDAATIVEKRGIASRFEDVRPGDHLTIHGKLFDGQRLLATELELAQPSTAVSIHAPVQSAADPQIMLANVSIDTSTVPEYEFTGMFAAIGRKTFFEKAQIGRPVWGKGTLTGSVVTWSSMGIHE